MAEALCLSVRHAALAPQEGQHLVGLHADRPVLVGRRPGRLPCALVREEERARELGTVWVRDRPKVVDHGVIDHSTIGQEVVTILIVQSP